jgi:RecA/RadA recombinase
MIMTPESSTCDARTEAENAARLCLGFYRMSAEDTLEALGSLEASPQALSQEELWDVVARIATVNHELIITGEALASLPPTEWLWEPYIPLGHITDVFGNPGVCKSGFCLHVAKGLSQGGKWPDGTEIKIRSKTLWIDAEGAKTLVRDRLSKWNMVKKDLLLPKQHDIFSDFVIDPSSDRLIRKILEEHQMRLVVVDSLTGSHREKENEADSMKRLMEIFQQWAGTYHCAVALVHHPNKKHQLNFVQRLDLDRLRGSSVIAASARSVLAVDIVKDKESAEGDLHRLYQLKNSLGRREDKDLFFRVKDDGIHFVEPDPAMFASCILTESKMEQAKRIIAEMLADGPKTAKEMKKKLESEGIAAATWKRAKSDLNVKSEKDGEEWRWILPT